MPMRMAREKRPSGVKSELEGDIAMDEDDDRGSCAESNHRGQDARGFALRSEVMVV